MEFEHIDDYNELLMPKKEHKNGADFKDLVTRHFDYEKDKNGELQWTGSDLILCLFEMVTLKDEKNALGETLLRSFIGRPEAETFINNYRRIVNDVQRNKDCLDSISKYRNWYKMGTFMLITSNPERISDKFPNGSSWESQPPNTREDPDKNAESYGYLTDEITDQDVKKYLTIYYDKLKNDLNFKIYPHVCIIVKPIAVSYGSNITPLGNFYLHFATRRERSRKFYLKFINDFIRVWYKEKGYESIRKIEDVAVAKALASNKEQEVEYLPIFRNDKVHMLNKIRSFYTLLYSDEERLCHFEQQLKSKVNEVFPIYVDIKKGLLQHHNNASLYSNLRQSVTKKSYQNLITNFDMNVFCEILIYREVYKIGVLIFDLDPYGLHYALKHGEYKEIKKPIVDTGAEYNYLWSSRFIPFIKANSYSKTRVVNDLITCMSKVENDYFALYKEMYSKLE